jgi:hypothetical protein
MGELRIKVQAVGDAELEVWAAHKQLHALAEALGKKVRLEKVPYRKASVPSAALVKNSAAVNTDLTLKKLPRNRRRLS